MRPIPTAVDELLRRPNPAVIASVRRDGSPHTVATWYEWDGSGILVNMDATRLRLRFMRHDPRVSLTVLDRDDWYRHVSLTGDVVSIGADPDLRDIDRIARHYTGEPFPRRDGRRFTARIRVHGWHTWWGGGPWDPEG